MKQQRRYYYFVAGLTDLLFDSGRNYPDMAEFREDLKHNLHPDDYSFITILFLPIDNRNLISFLENNEGEWLGPANYSKDDFEEQMRIIGSILKEQDILPAYMVKIMRDWIASEGEIRTGELRKALAEGYISIALGSGNKFLEKWVRFDTDLQNIFTFLNSKALDIDPLAHFVGDDPFTGELLDLFRSGKDFSMSFESEYAPAIFKIAVESEFLERERKTDLFRWDFIDTINFFEYFTIDLILGYLIKYSIVLRWAELDPGTGKDMLNKFIRETESRISTGIKNEHD